MNSPPEPAAWTHCTSALCAVPSAVALDFLADGLELGRWALGAWNTETIGDGVYRGRSLFDDSVAYVKPEVDRLHGSVAYHVGDAPGRLVPRIRALVVPSRVRAVESGQCVVTLIAWRDGSMDDARWLRLVRCHETEILLIQALLARRSPYAASTA